MIDGLFLLLGSNVAGSNEFLARARKELSIILGEPKHESSIYKTEPWGNKEQEWFLNQVICFKIPNNEPGKLLSQLKDLEISIGRKQREHWGPREIDIDILYWGDISVQSQDLEIPHPSIQDRRFTLEPLVEIASNMIHPVLSKTQSELLEECKDVSKVSLWSNAGDN